MSRLTFAKHDGTRLVVEVPKGWNAPFLARQMQRANRGLPVTGVTEAEMDFIADVAAQLMEPAQEPAKSAG